MTRILPTRRTLLAAGGAALATGLLPAPASSLKPTATMRGGSNNYRPGAPIVDRIGGGDGGNPGGDPGSFVLRLQGNPRHDIT